MPGTRWGLHPAAQFEQSGIAEGRWGHVGRNGKLLPVPRMDAAKRAALPAFPRGNLCAWPDFFRRGAVVVI